MAGCAYNLTRTMTATLPYLKKGIHFVKETSHLKCFQNAPSIILNKHNLPHHIDRTATYDEVTVSGSYISNNSYFTATIGGCYYSPESSIFIHSSKLKGGRLGVVWVGEYPVNDMDINTDDIVVIGHDKKITGVDSFTTDQLTLAGVNRTVRQTLGWNLKDCDQLHVVYNGGSLTKLPYRQMCEIAFMLNSDLRLKGLNLFNYNPNDDDKDFSNGLLLTDAILITTTGRSLF